LTIPPYVTAGDHDLWDARDKTASAVINFNQVFKSPNQTFIDSGIRFVIVFNADNYEGIDSLQMAWLKEILGEKSRSSKNTFVFLHEALMHPSSDRFMGSAVKDEEKGGEANKIIAGQAQTLIQVFKDAGVSEVFAGDIHAYSRYSDPKTGLKMTTVGALTSERNLEKPSFVIVDVYENGGYNVSKVEI